MRERCVLCGGSQSTVKTYHWVSESSYIMYVYIHVDYLHVQIQCDKCDAWVCFNCNDLNSDDITESLVFHCLECTYHREQFE